jgi:hypothetical protein
MAPRFLPRLTCRSLPAIAAAARACAVYHQQKGGRGLERRDKASWTASVARWRLSEIRTDVAALSGGDRKAQAKGIRQAHGIHASHYRQSVLIWGAAEAKIREADRLECEGWNAISGPGPRDALARRAVGGADDHQGDQRRIRPAGA